MLLNEPPFGTATVFGAQKIEVSNVETRRVGEQFFILCFS